MAAQLVTLILDRYSGAQKPYVRGGGTLTPSLEFPDPADQMLIGRAPVPFSFRAGSLPAVEVVANDTAGPQQENGLPGWTWDFDWDPSTPGSPAPASYYILSTNGSIQYLSDLASVPAAQPGQQYVPLPSTPPSSSAKVLGLASVSPLVTEWVDESGGGSIPTGILKGAGGEIEAATAGTDYLAPGGDGSQLTGLTQGQIAGLAAALALLAPLANAALTGAPTAPTPTTATGIANKAYVDAVAQGLDTKPSVAVVATSNITLSGTQTIDGVAVTAGMRVLPVAQSTASQNGPWIAAAGAWSRPADFASGSTQLGAFAFVEAGTNGASSGWTLAGTTAVTVDTTAQAWTQFSGAGEIQAGTGLAKNGNALSVSYGTSAGTAAQGNDSRITGAATATALTNEINRAEAAETALAGQIPSLPLSPANGGTGGSTAPQNQVFAGPASGGAGTPGYRALTAGDLPVVAGDYLCAASEYGPSTRTAMTVTTTTLAAWSSANVTTNPFTAPASGIVIVEVDTGAVAVSASGDIVAFALADHGTLNQRGTVKTIAVSGTNVPQNLPLRFKVVSLTPGSTYQFDLLGCNTTGDTATMYAQDQSLSTLQSPGGPVEMTVQAA